MAVSRTNCTLNWIEIQFLIVYQISTKVTFTWNIHSSLDDRNSTIFTVMCLPLFDMTQKFGDLFWNYSYEHKMKFQQSDERTDKTLRSHCQSLESGIVLLIWRFSYRIGIFVTSHTANVIVNVDCLELEVFFRWV